MLLSCIVIRVLASDRVLPGRKVLVAERLPRANWAHFTHTTVHIILVYDVLSLLQVFLHIRLVIRLALMMCLVVRVEVDADDRRLDPIGLLVKLIATSGFLILDGLICVGLEDTAG